MSANHTAFVLMPFANEFNEIYDHLIKGALSEAGYLVTRADDIRNQQNILADVVQAICKSNLIVADLSTSNANVYYELGLAHAFSKPVILLAQDINEVPFDLRSYRILTYATHFSRMNEARNELRELAITILEGSVQFGSPVSDFAGISGNKQIAKFPSVIRNEGKSRDDRGLLDFQFEVEEGFSVIATVIAEVGERLNVLTPEVSVVGAQLHTNSNTSKQRTSVRKLAASLEDYANWLHQGNTQYRQALSRISESLNALFSGEFNVGENISELQTFTSVIQNVEQQAQGGLESISGLVSVMDKLPRIEKEFNKAKHRVSSELKELVCNIDQTIATLARARYSATHNLGKTEI